MHCDICGNYGDLIDLSGREICIDCRPKPCPIDPFSVSEFLAEEQIGTENSEV